MICQKAILSYRSWLVSLEGQEYLQIPLNAFPIAPKRWGAHLPGATAGGLHPHSTSSSWHTGTFEAHSTTLHNTLLYRALVVKYLWGLAIWAPITAWEYIGAVLTAWQRAAPQNGERGAESSHSPLCDATKTKTASLWAGEITPSGEGCCRAVGYGAKAGREGRVRGNRAVSKWEPRPASAITIF